MLVRSWWKWILLCVLSNRCIYTYTGYIVCTSRCARVITLYVCVSVCTCVQLLIGIGTADVKVAFYHSYRGRSHWPCSRAGVSET